MNQPETTDTKTTKRTGRKPEPSEPSPIEAHAAHLERKAQLDAAAEAALEKAGAAALAFEHDPTAETSSAYDVAKQRGKNAVKVAAQYAEESRPIVQAYRDHRAAQALAAADHRYFRAEVERRLGVIQRAIETITDELGEIGVLDEEQRLLVENARSWGATAPRIAVEHSLQHANAIATKRRQDDIASRRRPLVQVTLPTHLDGLQADWPGLTAEERTLAAQRAQMRIQQKEEQS